MLSNKNRPEASRLVAIRLALHTLRLMEHWRDVWGDIDRALIVLGVSAVLSEKLTRTDLPRELQNLSRELPPEYLAKIGICKVSSIAAATGLNRETTRRKVNQMIDDGILVRSDDGTILFAPGIGQREAIGELIQRQLETFTRTANELIGDGAVRVRDSDEAERS